MKSIFNKKLLEGKKILITGASSGIGLETSIELSRLGAVLVLVGRSKDKLKNCMEFMDNPKNILIFEKDLSQIDSGMTILKNLPSDFLPLDGIFHAAGTVLIKPFPLCKKDDFDNMSNIALHSLLSFSKLFHRKKFFNDNASIIVMSSVASEYGTPGLGYYSAIKSAINSSCRNMAIEFSNRNIRVNAILSGAIKTQMHNKITSKLDSKTINEYEKKHPLGFGETKDITPMVCLLMSNASSWITGALINIDGGYSAFK